MEKPLHDATQPGSFVDVGISSTPFPFRRSGFSQAVGSAKWWLPFGLFLVQQGGNAPAAGDALQDAWIFSR